MTRVLFLTESFHPVLGGGEAHIRALSRALAAAGRPCTVLTRRGEAGWPAEEDLDGVRVLRVGPPGPGRTGKYAMVPAVLAALWRERRSYDVLVVRGTRVLGLPGLLAARLTGKAVVLQAEVNGEMSGEVYTWGTALERGPGPPLVRLAVRARNALLRDADAFVAMSARIRDEFAVAGVAAHRIAHIPHGVDLERFRPARPGEREALRARHGLPADGRIAIYTGRLLRGKGLETLLEAFARVAATDERAHLVLAGSGEGQALSVENALRARARAPDLAGRVAFPGRVEDVADWLRAADLFVFPSVFEALGLSLVEASACGLPCLGTRTGGIVDVIEDGASGRLLPPDEVEAWAAAMAALLADPERRGALGARAGAIARMRFDARDAVERYRTLFDELAAVRRRPGRAAVGAARA